VLTFLNILTWAVVFLPITAVLVLRAAIMVAKRSGRMPQSLARIDLVLNGK
jgi:hypothetical protein